MTRGGVPIRSQVLWHVLHSALRRVVLVLVLHVSPKGRREGARVRVAARRSILFLKSGAVGKRARSDEETVDEELWGAWG